MSHDISRRTFLKLLGGGLAGAAAGGALVKREDILAFLDADKAAGAAGTDLGKVTTRYYKPLGKDLSLLGFGCMRLPTTFTASGREIDKELGEKMVDFAYRHGINYFDRSGKGYLPDPARPLPSCVFRQLHASFPDQSGPVR